MQIRNSLSSLFTKSNTHQSDLPEDELKRRERYGITGLLDTDRHMNLFLNQDDQLNLRLVSRGLNQSVFGPLMKTKVTCLYKISLNSKISSLLKKMDERVCGYDSDDLEEKNFFSSIAIRSVDAENKIIATSDAFGTIKIRNYHTGMRIRKFRIQNSKHGHHPLLITPCGKKLMIAFPSGMIKMVCLSTGNEFLTLTGHTNRVDALKISKCGQKLVTGSFDGTVKIWDLIEGRLIFSIPEHLGRFRFLEISPCGRMLVAASSSSFAQIWDLDTGKKMCRLPFYNKDLTSFAIRPCGKKLVAGSLDGSIKIWNLHEGNGICFSKSLGEFGHFISKLNPICWVFMLSCGKKFVTADIGGVIRIWNLENSVRCISMVRLPERISSFAMSPCGKHFLTMDFSGLNVKTWAMEDVLFDGSV